MVPSLLLHWAMRLGCIELREEVMPVLLVVVDEDVEVLFQLLIGAF